MGFAAHSGPTPDAGASDTYRTLAARAEAELRDRGSRFVAEAMPVVSEAEAEAAIAAVRRREHAATHHGTAYRVGPEGGVFRYDDDGEPTGTTGPPILQQIDGRGLTNALVVVTRYYGGTKLGTGGLVRAYGGAAALALDAAPTATVVRRVPLRVGFAYDDTAAAEATLRRFDAEVTARDYGAAVALTVAVRRSEAEAFAQAFTNALGGRGRVLRKGEGAKG
jgi:uncharacterized YigZ family protein